MLSYRLSRNAHIAMLLSIFLYLIGVCECKDSHRPVVHTAQGVLRGTELRTRGMRSVAAFMSIPFAAPPVGQLRFKAPVPAEPWEGELDASKESPECVQRNPYIRQESIVGQEDCLYLNVYTPKMPRKHHSGGLLPVMVFLHGGGWMCGTASRTMYGPEYLLDRDVVFVAPNYRLGPLGFLSTLDKNCPGNNGLKDQQEAFRWIQKNIHHFGGDNSSVTIFGESAGGASVHFHMLSPTSTGLFHKAISQSGTALVPWAQAPAGEPLRQALRLARLLGCPPAPSQRLIDCLRAKDAIDIIATEFDFYAWDYEPMTPFKAVIEPDLPGAFLTKDARIAPESPPVPWITGLNQNEGCLKSVWITQNESRLSEFSEGFDSIAPITFYYENSPNAESITDSIRHVYLNNKHGKLGEQEKQGIADIFTDSYFAYPAVEAIELTFAQSKNPIYLYQLEYRGTNSFSQVFGDPDGNHGVCHADELMYLFPIFFLTKPWSAQDKQMIDTVVTLWTNFATTGNPNKPRKVSSEEWKPITDPHKMEYLKIDQKLKMSENLAARSKIWDTFPLWHKFLKKTSSKDEL